MMDLPYQFPGFLFVKSRKTSKNHTKKGTKDFVVLKVVFVVLPYFNNSQYFAAITFLKVIAIHGGKIL